MKTIRLCKMGPDRDYDWDSVEEKIDDNKREWHSFLCLVWRFRVSFPSSQKCR